MALKKREVFLFYAVIMLLVGWFVIRIVFVPFHEKLSELDRKVVLEEARLKRGACLLEKKEEIVKAYERFESYYSLRNLSDEEVVASLQKELLDIGNGSGLTIQDMKPQKEVASDKVSRHYSINIKAEGSLTQFINFLYALYNSQFLFSIDKMDLAPDREGSAFLKISMKVIGVSFL